MAIPAVGTAVACMVLIVGSTRPKPEPETANGGDARLFAEIYESVHADVPRAAQPIRALFAGHTVAEGK